MKRQSFTSRLTKCWKPLSRITCLRHRECSVFSQRTRMVMTWSSGLMKTGLTKESGFTPYANKSKRTVTSPTMPSLIFSAMTLPRVITSGDSWWEFTALTSGQRIWKSSMIPTRQSWPKPLLTVALKPLPNYFITVPGWRGPLRALISFPEKN